MIRTGARVFLLDGRDRVLLIHALDPDLPANRWWELPGGGVEGDESLEQAALRELTEETGIVADGLGPRLWVRESRFRYRNRDHHRVDHVFLVRQENPVATVARRPTEDERLGVIEQAWFTADELRACPDRLVPPELPALLADIVAGNLPPEPIFLRG